MLGFTSHVVSPEGHCLMIFHSSSSDHEIWARQKSPLSWKKSDLTNWNILHHWLVQLTIHLVYIYIYICVCVCVTNIYIYIWYIYICYILHIIYIYIRTYLSTQVVRTFMVKSFWASPESWIAPPKLAKRSRTKDWCCSWNRQKWQRLFEGKRKNNTLWLFNIAIENGHL